MILHPPVLALLVGSGLMSFMLVYAACYGIAVLRRWDITSGSELQLGLERKTYLISTLVSYAFGFQLLSLFLFVYIADDLSRLLVGAMCAAGTLNVDAFGYPALLLMMVNFVLAGVWLIVNYVDNKAYDYPLIRKKYLFLLLITPAMLAQTVLQILYLSGLKPDIITSCCSTIFSAAASDMEGEGMGAGAGGLPLGIFFTVMGTTLLGGIYVYRSRGRGAYPFALMSGGTFIASIATLIAVFSLYIYELPTHHCPFCLLQGEYGYAGYPLYLALFGGAVTGIGAGVVAPATKIKSLTAIVPGIQRRLVLASMICYAVFTIIVLVNMMTSNLIMEG